MILYCGLRIEAPERLKASLPHTLTLSRRRYMVRTSMDSRQFAPIAAILVAVGLLPCAAHPLPSVHGGTPHERYEVKSLLRHQLHGLLIARRSMVIVIVPEQRMAPIAAEEGFIAPPSAKASDDIIDGLYSDNPPTITLASGVDDDPDFRETFVHEYGHHLWVHFLKSRERERYIALYNRQLARGRLVTDYAKVSVEEGFAESFAYYIVQPKVLLHRDSTSYRFMEWMTRRIRIAGMEAEHHDLTRSQHS